MRFLAKITGICAGLVLGLSASISATPIHSEKRVSVRAAVHHIHTLKSFFTFLATPEHASPDTAILGQVVDFVEQKIFIAAKVEPARVKRSPKRRVGHNEQARKATRMARFSGDGKSAFHTANFVAQDKCANYAGAQATRAAGGAEILSDSLNCHEKGYFIAMEFHSYAQIGQKSESARLGDLCPNSQVNRVSHIFSVHTALGGRGLPSLNRSRDIMPPIDLQALGSAHSWGFSQQLRISTAARSSYRNLKYWSGKVLMEQVRQHKAAIAIVMPSLQATLVSAPALPDINLSTTGLRLLHFS